MHLALIIFGPTLIVFAATLASMHYLDYLPFGVARRVASGESLLQSLREEIYLLDLDQSFEEAETAHDCWLIVREVCDEMRFSTVGMCLAHNWYTANFREDTGTFASHIAITFGEHGQLTLSRTGDAGNAGMSSSILDHLQQKLAQKERSFAQDNTVFDPIRAEELAVVGDPL